MVNNRVSPLRSVHTVVCGYVVLALGTVVALAVLSVMEPRLAPQEAWVHAVIVAVLSVVLLLRLRAARRGSTSALRAVRIICTVLVVANLVIAGIPAFLPTWMRVESVAIAVLLAGAVWLLVRAGRRNRVSSRVDRAEDLSAGREAR